MTIAIFSTYRPSEGFGGPARTYHQRVVLESAGFRVVHVVVEASPTRGAMRGQDLVQLVERPFRESLDHIYSDVDLGQRAVADKNVVKRVTEHLRQQGTLAIILEQPFLVDLVAQIADAIGAPVLYSCQNIEHQLRRDLERFQFMLDRPLTRSDEVRVLEQRAVDLAAEVTTICLTDHQAMKEQFGCDSVIVPNGTSVASMLDDEQPSLKEGVDFVFAGSSYWPNVEGFGAIAAPSLAFLPPTTRIHVIGSVCNDLLGLPVIARRHSVNASRMALQGFLPMGELVDIMASARAVLVPVFIGEGSNLKSADALAAGVPVVMTRRATRGYEDVIAADPEGVIVVDDAKSFRAEMKQIIEAPRSTRAIGRDRRQMLTWSSRLQPLAAALVAMPGVAA